VLRSTGRQWRRAVARMLQWRPGSSHRTACQRQRWQAFSCSYNSQPAAVPLRPAPGAFFIRQPEQRLYASFCRSCDKSNMRQPVRRLSITGRRQRLPPPRRTYAHAAKSSRCRRSRKSEREGRRDSGRWRCRRYCAQMLRGAIESAQAAAGGIERVAAAAAALHAARCHAQQCRFQQAASSTRRAVVFFGVCL